MNKHVGKAVQGIAYRALFFLLVIVLGILGANTLWDGICLLIKDGWYSADLWFLGLCLLTGLMYGLIKLLNKHRDIVDTE